MPDGDNPRPAGAGAPKLAAFCVHVLTACGGACAFMALIAAIDENWSRMFAWLGVAVVVDGIDGPLARRLKVAEVLPDWSGDTLDLVVDFLTYVFVPAYAIAASGLLPDLFVLPAGLLIIVTGSLYFSDTRMKTADNYFRGFPSLWNVVAFYLLLLAPPPWIGAAAIATLLVLTFVPFPFLHPIRVKRFRTLNLTLMALWAALALVAIVRDMSPGPYVTGALCAIGIYVLGAGVLRRPAADRATG
jgi:phosphatidylcholine synthase